MLLALAQPACQHSGWSDLPRDAHFALKGLNAEFFVCETPGLMRRGENRVAVLRFNQATTALPHHFRDEGLKEPLEIDGWQRQLACAVVVNAGLYGSDLAHQGVLQAHGRLLPSVKKNGWKGYLVGDAPAHLVDTQQGENPAPTDAAHLLQSMMLLDESGQVRCETSGLSASRTVVAEDYHGRLLVLVTQGATTLAELARWLKQSGLGVRHALNLDGGFESQLAVYTPELTLLLRGQYGVNFTGLFSRPLPAVVSFE